MTTSPSDAPAPTEAFMAYAIRELRGHESLSHLKRMILAVDRGEVDPNLKDGKGRSVLASSLEGWYRLNSSDGAPALDEEKLSRWATSAGPGRPGESHPFEALAGALLRRGADPFPSSAPVEVLLAAIKEGAPSVAMTLLEHPSCPDLRRADPASACLASALIRGNSLVVETLMKKGVRLDVTVPENQPVWFLARSARDLDALLAAGIDPNQVNGKGETASEVWARSLSTPAALKPMTAAIRSRLSKEGAFLEVSNGAFAAIESLRVGVMESFLKEGPALFHQTRHVPGVENEEETLVEKALRLVFQTQPLNFWARKQSRSRAAPVAFLSRLMESPYVSDDEHDAVAMTLQGLALALREDEMGAKKDLARLDLSLRLSGDRMGAIRLCCRVLSRIARSQRSGMLDGRSYLPPAQAILFSVAGLLNAKANRRAPGPGLPPGAGSMLASVLGGLSATVRAKVDSTDDIVSLTKAMVSDYSSNPPKAFPDPLCALGWLVCSNFPRAHAAVFGRANEKKSHAALLESLNLLSTATLSSEGSRVLMEEVQRGLNAAEATDEMRENLAALVASRLDQALPSSIPSSPRARL